MAKSLRKRIEITKAELRKWQSAISRIGRDPYIIGARKEYCSLDKGGAINALGERELYKVPYRPCHYDSGGKRFEYHRPPRKKELDYETSKRVQDPSPELAQKLIVGSLEDIVDTRDPLKTIKNFKTKRKEITDELVDSRKAIEIPYKTGISYHSIQKNLSDTVRKMVIIEYDYKDELAKLEKQRALEIAKKGAKVGAVAASAAVAVYILSKAKKLKYLLSLVKP